MPLLHAILRKARRLLYFRLRHYFRRLRCWPSDYAAAAAAAVTRRSHADYCCC